MTNAANRFSQPQFSPLSLARSVWKHKALALGLWCVLTAAGVFVARRLPAVYKAEALILVDPQKVPERFVESTVTEDLSERLATISQEIQSAPRLQEIIDELGLYRQARKTHYREDVLAMMRKDIDIKVEKGRAFRISYQAPDPQTAAKVVNRITGLYMNENLKSRETQAEGTTEFLQTQLDQAEQALKNQEAAVSRYKLSHNGELPEQESSLSGTLTRLQIGLQGNQDATNRAQQEKIGIQTALEAAESSEAALRRSKEVKAHTSIGPDAPSAPASDTTLAELKAQLAGLQERYTEDFPEVLQLRAKISRLERARVKERLLEKQLAARAPAPEASDTAESISDSPELLASHERILSLRSRLTVIQQQLDQQSQDRGRIIDDISAYQARLNQLPLREQEMASLTRDYEISKHNYQTLLDKKNAAEMAGELEHRQKAERFRILDPARPPDVPAKPNRRVLYAVSLLGGLALSLALPIALELRKGVLLGNWELPKDVEVLATIPAIGAPHRPALGSHNVESGKRPLGAGAVASAGWLVAAPLVLSLLRFVRNL